ncbi:MAG: hypothetical protein J0L96_02870 [Anaerolineae bacterium]|nr:hypothetical protein [Anaerolineae bacterium]
MPRKVLWAILIGSALHGFFVLTARYHWSYDAYTHMLFGNHYRENWFGLWEPRWYTGFEVVSYPPLIHQLVGAFAFLVGFEAAFAIMLWLITSLVPLAIYSWSHIFIGKTASAHAALISAIHLPIFVTAHIFGQLPFLAATTLALFEMSALALYLKHGKPRHLFLAVALTATTMAAHHATLMAQPFLGFAVVVAYVERENLKTIALRVTHYLLLAIPAGVLVIWPFWAWGQTQQLQTPIDHLSRYNFFQSALAAAIFFLPYYLPLGFILPFLVKKINKKHFGLAFAFLFFFIIGLGGTTPLPKILLGKNWEWLTYDRFAFWASLLLVTFLGMNFARLKQRWRLTLPFGFLPRWKVNPTHLIIAFLFCLSLLSWTTPFMLPLQPSEIDMQPIVSFLEEDNHSDWRYLTFGFGDQFAHLNLLTTATTIDGSYHTARTLPELRQSGIGQIDTTFWALKGIPAIRPILQKSGEHGVRWGFVNKWEYVLELNKAGWKYKQTLSNNISVWENPNAIRPEPFQPPQVSKLESLSWGILPMFSLFCTGWLTILCFKPLQRRSKGAPTQPVHQPPWH